MDDTADRETSGPTPASRRDAAVRVAHVALWTADLDASAAFWSRFFGASIGERYESRRRVGFASRFLKFKDGPTIELMTGPWIEGVSPSDREAAGWAHVAVSLGSEEAVRDLARRLDDEGLLVAQPRWTGDGFYEAVARAPDGALVEIMA